ncbi:hypothetical protein F4825DRAFT_450829 [Nemania diffusa]|nr:hypothetical protein F4825DRAFT_450829 [Nemania diffusa]
MRLHTLVAVLAAAGTAADTNTQATRQRRQRAVDVAGFQGQASPSLAVQSSSSRYSPSTRRSNLWRDHRDLSTTLSKRDGDDDDDDDDSDDDSDDDDDDDDDDEDGDGDGDEKRRHRTHAGAIAGGIIGGIILLLLLLFLLYWFKLRPRRQRRRKRQRKDEEEEEERRRRYEQENAHYAPANQRSYHPVASTSADDDEPPRYQQVVAGGVPTRAPATSPPQPQPRGTVESPAELPSPVDGREPSSFPRADYSKGSRASYLQLQSPSAHPADQPNPTYS